MKLLLRLLFGRNSVVSSELRSRKARESRTLQQVLKNEILILTKCCDYKELYRSLV